MKLISHRGNFNGPNPETENTPRQIKKIIENYGIHVEADIWYIPSEGHFYLGHDEPKCRIEKKFILEYRDMLYLHAKSIKTLEKLNTFYEINCFFHNDDECTLVSNGEIWIHGGNTLYSINNKCFNNCIYSINDTAITPFKNLKRMYGICTDYPQHFINLGF